MRIHVSHPGLVLDLLRFLRQSVDTVAQVAGTDRLDVSILGSRHAEAEELELDRRLAGWRAAHPLVGVSVVQASREEVPAARPCGSDGVLRLVPGSLVRIQEYLHERARVAEAKHDETACEGAELRRLISPAHRVRPDARADEAAPRASARGRGVHPPVEADRHSSAT